LVVFIDVECANGAKRQSEFSVFLLIFYHPDRPPGATGDRETVTGAGDREAVVGAGDGDREAVTAAGMGKRWRSHNCFHKIHFNEYFYANRLTSGK
jgi:hypothetical protein